MDGRSLARLKRELDGFVGGLLVDLSRRDQRAWATAHLRGLLLDGGLKSVGPMAERLAAVDHEPAGGRRDYEQSLQQFVGQSPWPAGAVWDRLQRWLAARGRRRAGATAVELLILDDAGFPEQGTASVGVARQYTGTLGKVASCQVAVTLRHARQPAAADTAAGGEVFCVDARLYPPETGWRDDRRRMDAAGAPADVGVSAQVADRPGHARPGAGQRAGRRRAGRQPVRHRHRVPPGPGRAGLGLVRRDRFDRCR